MLLFQRLMPSGQVGDHGGCVATHVEEGCVILTLKPEINAIYVLIRCKAERGNAVWLNMVEVQQFVQPANQQRGHAMNMCYVVSRPLSFPILSSGELRMLSRSLSVY